jgi:hypothetical protein
MFGNPFYRTSLEYWNSSSLNYTWYWILAVFLGWAGLDMLYLRSPLGMIGKIFLNAITFGFIWFYDAIQATFNQPQVKLAGPSNPFYGPLGIAGAMFMGTGSKESQDKHYYFLIYALVLIFTGILGGDSFLVGDKLSGYIRLISLFSFIFAPIAIFWWLYKLYQLFIRPDQLLDQNYRFFGAPEPANRDLMCPNALEVMTAWVFDTSSVVLDYIPVLNNFAPLIRGIGESLRTAYGITVSTVQTAQDVAEQGPEMLDQITSVREVNPSEVAKTLQQTTKTVGGAQQPTVESSMFVFAIGFVIISSLSMTFWRVYKNYKNGTESESDQRADQKTDEPPHPGVSRGTPTK